MTPDEAAWVRDNILTAAIRKTPHTACACQYGPSSDCHHGDHHRCRHGSEPVVMPYAYITRADGTVPLDVDTAQVWLASHTCAWRCRCDCHLTWWVDKPGNVVHRGDCPNRADAKHWPAADGKNWDAVTVLLYPSSLCPAPCARGLSCADFGIAPSAPEQLDLLSEAS